MSEHLTNTQIANYSARRTASNELLAITRHLAVCDECRQRVAAQHRTTERVAALQMALRTDAIPAHLSYEQLVAYVEEDTDTVEQEIIQNHLASCAQCTAEAADLQSLHDRATPPQPTPSTWSAWLRGGWPRLWQPVALTAVAAALLIACVWWMRRTPMPEPHIVAATPPPMPIGPVPVAPSPVVSPTPTVVVSLTDKGGVIALDDAGNVTGLTDLPPEVARTLKQTLQSQTLATSAELPSLQRRPPTLMSDAPEQSALKLRSPVGTFVKDTQPTLHWQPLPNAQHYVVSVLDTNFNVVATSPTLAQTQWRVATPLRHGQEYVWQVSTEVDGKRVTSASANAPEAHFKILSAEKAREIQTLTQRYDSHLLRGTLYAKAGLLTEAESELQALQRANPRSTLARKLLRHVRALRQP